MISTEDYDGQGSCWPCYCAARERSTRLPQREVSFSGLEHPGRRQAYTRLFHRVWDRLEALGPTYVIAVGHIASYCPVCHVGTIGVRFVDSDPPWLRLPEACSDGCGAHLIAEALK